MANSTSPRSEPDPLRIVGRAIAFAARRHRFQMRKDNETPYIAHPYRVLFILSHLFKVTDPDVLAAGVLHDTIEDTNTDFDDVAAQFGERVAGFVATLSKDKRVREPEREKAFFDALAAAPVEVKLCKLADTLDNVLDVLGMNDAQREKTFKKARHLLETFRGKIPPEWSHAYEALRSRVEA